MNCPCCGLSGPCFCSRNRPARPRNTGYPAPTYRRPPQSHAYNCRCARCASFNSKQDPMMGGLGILIIMFAVAAVIAGIGAGVKGAAHHPAQAAWIAGGVVAFALLVGSIIVADRREARRSPRPPKGRLRVEATQQAPPLCFHRNAISVNNIVTGELEARLCPDCGTQLDVTWPVIPGRAWR